MVLNMEKSWKWVFTSLLIIFSYHLIRDILQINGVWFWLTRLAHWPRQWCSPNCDYVTLWAESFGIVGSLIVLKRDRVGLLGRLTLLSAIGWPIGLVIR